MVTTLEAVTKTVEEALRRYTCSWKRQFKNHKFESLELESFCLSWKGPSEVGKDQVKSERTERSRKVSLQLERLNDWKVSLHFIIQSYQKLCEVHHSLWSMEFCQK